MTWILVITLVFGNWSWGRGGSNRKGTVVEIPFATQAACIDAAEVYLKHNRGKRNGPSFVTALCFKKTTS